MYEMDAQRRELLETLYHAGRQHSTATVLFHTALSERLGLGVSDMKTLDYLARLGPLTAKEIGEQTGLATASVTGLIDRLEQKGFVRRERDAHDRRKVIVALVSEREAEFTYLFQSFGTSLMELLAGYDNAQLQVIGDFLTRTAEIARREALKLRKNAEADSETSGSD